MFPVKNFGQSEISPIYDFFSETCRVQSENLSAWICNLSDPKRSTSEKVWINPKFVRNFEPEIIFVKVKIENCPVASGICPIKTSNPEWVRNNSKFVRNLEPGTIFVKVKMENCPAESGFCPVKNVKSEIRLKETEICPLLRTGNYFS